jgi:hypothetical protein
MLVPNKVVSHGRLPVMRIRRVTEHAYGQQKQNRPGDTAGSIQPYIAELGHRLIVVVAAGLRKPTEATAPAAPAPDDTDAD